MATEPKKSRRRPGNFLKKRGRMWHARFQYPEALRQSAMDLYGVSEWPFDKTFPLETDDELEARRRAQPLITAHLELLLYHKARNDDQHHWADIDGPGEWIAEPSDHVQRLTDGTQIAASTANITTIHPDGRVEVSPNARKPKRLTEKEAE